MSKPLILFRFHKDFDVCAQHIDLLRRMNPGVSIHGLYGGAGGVAALPDEFAKSFETIFALPFEDPNYNYAHGDICVRWWYKELGHKLDFTHLCVAEWDMVYLKLLADIYGGFAPAANYYAISGTYQYVLEKEWPWIQGRFKAPFDKLSKEVMDEKGIDTTKLSYGIFGGCVLCREFLDKLSARVIRSYCNDEVRLAVYAVLFDIPVVDCGFLTDKRNFVDASELEFGEKEIRATLANGGSMLHPIRVLIEGLEGIVFSG